MRSSAGRADTNSMRRFLCVLLGHRLGPPESIAGVSVRSCERCDKAA